MNTGLRVIILVILLLTIGTVGYFVRRDTGNNGLTLYGNVDIRKVNLGFRTFGRLVEMRFEEGDAVKAGEVIAFLDANPYRNELTAAEVRVSRAKANLNRLKTGSRPQEIESARAQVREAQAAYRNARRDLGRQRELVAVDAFSQRVLDQAQSTHDETAARLKVAQETLALAEEGFRSEEVTAGQAELAEAIAQQDLAQATWTTASCMHPTRV